MAQNLLKRIFTLDVRKQFFSSQRYPDFHQFAVDNLGDSIYVFFGHSIQVFSISEFPYERPLGRSKGIDAIYINHIDIEENLGLLAIGGNHYSGNPPLKIYDVRNHKFQWIVSSFTREFIEKSRQVGKKVSDRHECIIINLPVFRVSDVKISPNGDYLVAYCVDATEKLKSKPLKKFSLEGNILAECNVPNLTDFSIHPKGKVIAAISGKSILFINPSSLEVFLTKELTSATASSITFDNEGKQLLITSQEGEIISINLELGMLWSIRIDAIPRCVKYDPFSNCFFVGTNLADVLMFDTDGTLVNSNRVSESVRDICFLHQGRHILVGCKNMDFHIFANGEREIKASDKEWELRLANANYDSSLYTSTQQLKNLRTFNPSTSITNKYDVELISSKEQIEIHRRYNTDLLEIIKAVVGKPINIQNLTTSEIKLMAEKSEVNQNFSGSVGSVTGKNLGSIKAVQHNYAPEQRKSLAEAAAEIQNLLEQLSQTYPTKTPTDKAVIATKAVEQIEKNSTLKTRIVKSLKAGGTSALKELIDHPAINILLATLEGFQDS